jgi:hypothetical protein
MLKLEKQRKDHTISIVVGQKKPFFNQIFGYALAWAIGIHFLAWMIFHVAPFSLIPSGIIPPVTVVSDIGKPFYHTLAEAEEEVPIPSYLLLNFYTDVDESLVTLAPPEKTMDYLPYSKDAQHSFLAVEWPYFEDPFAPLAFKEASPLKIHVSGPLAALPQMFQGISFPAFLKLQRDYSVRFDVLVAGATGKVIWMQAQDAMPQPLAKWCDAAIKELLFSKSKEDIVKGSVYIHLKADPQELA